MKKINQQAFMRLFTKWIYGQKYVKVSIKNGVTPISYEDFMEQYELYEDEYSEADSAIKKAISMFKGKKPTKKNLE